MLIKLLASDPICFGCFPLRGRIAKQMALPSWVVRQATDPFIIHYNYRKKLVKIKIYTSEIRVLMANTGVDGNKDSDGTIHFFSFSIFDI